MKANRKRCPTRTPSWLLRREDQIAVAALVLLAAAGTLAWWLSHGGCRATLVEFEDSTPRQLGFQVNVNTADWPELTQLPQIGEALARKIVAYRHTHGPFRSHDELRQIKGIAEKKLKQIRPYLLPIAPANDESADPDTP